MSAIQWPHGNRCRVCVSLAEAAPERLFHRLVRLGEGDAQLAAEERPAADAAGDHGSAGGAPGAELVEIRLDALEDTDELTTGLFEELVERSPVPVGFTVRPSWQGGGYAGEEAQRRRILESAARVATGFVDVELDAGWSADFVATAPCPVVLSHHWDDAGTPDDLERRVAEARAAAPAVIKLVAIANAVDDAVPLLHAGAELAAAGQPATCFCMGEAGRASRLLAAARGAALIYAALNDGGEVAPGQWSLRVLVDELGVQYWQPSAELYAVIGNPVRHSLSPAIFNAVFRHRGAARAYVPLEGPDLDATLRLAAAVEMRGVSVTMPFKRQMAERSEERGPLVRATGAANTVVLSADGWHAYNTDGRAVVDALEAVRPIEGARIALVGAGGAACAAAVALAESGAELTVLNRTVERAEAVGRRAGAAWGAIERLRERHFDVVINATPVGMAGGAHAGETPFPVDWLAGGEVVFDMVYRPRQTPLLRGAAALGCAVISGLEMFVRQAAAQYRLLTGDRELTPLALMRAAAERILGEDDVEAQGTDPDGTE